MRDSSILKMEVWIVDDQEANVRLLEKMLTRAGYTRLRCFRDPREVLPAFLEGQPDLILLDLNMPHIDGLGVMKQLAPHIWPQDYMPILVLTADILPATKREALSSGAKDFLTKPFDATEVILRIQNLLEARSLNQRLQDLSLTLEFKIEERSRELEAAQYEMLDRLAKAAEYRDDETGHHTQRVGQLAAELAIAAGLPGTQCELIRQAATLHDVGKIGVRDNVLLKPGTLSPEEYKLMKSHTAWGARILGGSRFPVMQLASTIALYHHERWDGGGYHGLAGEDIPIEARLVTLADVFDVLTHARPYKEPWTVEKALDEVRRESGLIFDPRLVEVFLSDPFQRSLASLGEALLQAGDAEEFAEPALYDCPALDCIASSANGNGPTRTRA